MSKRLILTGEAARKAAHREVDEAPEGYECRIGPRNRSLGANARLHAMLTDIARQIDYMGQKRSVEAWKGLFVSGWELATGRKPEILAGLEHEFVNIRQSTTSMSGRDISSLMEYITAYAVQRGVKFSAREE